MLSPMPTAVDRMAPDQLPMSIELPLPFQRTSGLARRGERLLASPVGQVLLHAVVLLALAWWSWRKWPDPLTDFGRELYVPWQLAEGKVLYRDIASLFGPLSSYVNAAFFKAFGVSLTTLVFCNLAILSLMVAGIHYLVRTTCGVLVATLVTLSVLILFGFGHYVAVGNYNFVSPYAHEATHGMALSAAALVAAHLGLARRSLALFGLAGASFGLVLLTKPEVAVAAAAASTAGLGAAAWLTRDDRHLMLRAVPVFAAASLAAPLAFFGFFATHMPASDALAATAGAFAPLGAAGLSDGRFYQTVSGLDTPGANALRMLWSFAGIVVFVCAAAVVSRSAADGTRAWKNRSMRRVGWPASVACLLFLVPWGSMFPRALPLTTVAAIGGFVILFARRRNDRAEALRVVAALMWSVFALVLLAKMMLNVRIFHYGFYLALPATAVLIMSLTWLVPQAIEQRYSAEAGRVFRRISTWMLAACFVPYVLLSSWSYRDMTLPVGAGGDRFYATDLPLRWQGAAVAGALSTIDALTGPDDRVAVLPEGAMLNYLSRRESPLRVINVMPPELLVFGEQDVLESLQKGRPKLVLLVRRDMSEYGYPLFGSDARYGLRTAAWLDAHYERVPSAERGNGSEAAWIVALRRRGSD